MSYSDRFDHQITAADVREFGLDISLSDLLVALRIAGFDFLTGIDAVQVEEHAGALVRALPWIKSEVLRGLWGSFHSQPYPGNRLSAGRAVAGLLREVRGVDPATVLAAFRIGGPVVVAATVQSLGHWQRVDLIDLATWGFEERELRQLGKLKGEDLLSFALHAAKRHSTDR